MCNCVIDDSVCNICTATFNPKPVFRYVSFESRKAHKLVEITIQNVRVWTV